MHGNEVSISARVITEADLTARLAHERTRIEHDAVGFGPRPAGWPSPAALTTRDRAELLHQLWATVTPPQIARNPGLRGRVAFFTKRVTRRLVSWYIEPRWAAQQEIDAEVARFASNAAEALERLQREVSHLQQWNERLQRELRVTSKGLEPHRDASTVPAADTA
jgi:hypothetical protein